jgi:hypothetical protein
MGVRVIGGVVEIAVTGAPRRAAATGPTLTFAGDLGTWRLAGAPAGNTTWTEPLTDEAAGRLVALLSGGVATLSGSPPSRVVIPPAGARGQTWFSCVRAQLVL